MAGLGRKWTPGKLRVVSAIFIGGYPSHAAKPGFEPARSGPNRLRREYTLQRLLRTIVVFIQSRKQEHEAFVGVCQNHVTFRQRFATFSQMWVGHYLWPFPHAPARERGSGPLPPRRLAPVPPSRTANATELSLVFLASDFHPPSCRAHIRPGSYSLDWPLNGSETSASSNDASTSNPASSVDYRADY